MKNIVITQRIEISKYKELRAQLDIRFMNFVADCGYNPIQVPYFMYEEKKLKKYLSNWIKEINPEGIVLSGGEDIGKNRIRDFTEFYLLKFAVKKKIPLLGICRGMQVIAKHYGSKLIKVKNHVNKSHFVFYKNLKKKVNSFHNLAIKSCPKNFLIRYVSSDGVIESIQSSNLKIEGWMWHPERYNKFKKSDKVRFNKIFGK